MTKPQSPAVVMVMCTGNVCRSPMAEAALKHFIAEAGLEAEVISRGLAAPVGRLPHEFAVKVCEGAGIPIPQDKRAAAVSSAEMSLASVIFIMDQDHRREVQHRFPAATGKTFLLGHWGQGDIPDPINEPEPAFHQVWAQIHAGSQQWVEQLGRAGLIPSKQ